MPDGRAAPPLEPVDRDHAPVAPGVEVTAGRDPEITAGLLRERIYGDIACLSTLLVLAEYDSASNRAWPAVLQVLIASAGLWSAATLAEYVAHLGAHGSVARGKDLLALVRSCWQIMEAAFLPLLMLVLAGFGLFTLHTAIRIGIWILVVTLGLFALLAARRTNLRWWGRALLVLAIMGLGTLVVLLKTLAH